MEKGNTKKVSGSIGSILMNNTPALKVTRNMKPMESVSTSFDDQIKALKEAREDLAKQATKTIEAEKASGYRDGYKAGFDSGIKTAEEDTFNGNKELLGNITKIITELSDSIAKKAFEQKVMIANSIIVALEKSYFLSSKIDRKSILRITEASMESLPGYATNATIVCSDDDYEIIQGANPTIRVKKRDGLKSGSIIIDTDVGMVKMSSESISQAVIESILKEIK